MQTNDETATAEIERANRLALLAAVTVVVLPVVTTLVMIFISGFYDRSLEDNLFYLAIVLILPLDWALERLFFHHWWDRFSSPLLTKKHRENYAKSVLFGIIFSITSIELDNSTSENVLAILQDFPIYVGVFVLVHFLFDAIRARWKARKIKRRGSVGPTKL